MDHIVPDWMKEGKDTKIFFSWLMDEIQSYHGLLKVQKEECVLIYGNKSPDQPDGLHDLHLYGVFRKRDYTLYEVNTLLYQIAGIPTEFSFPEKDCIQRELECKVSTKGRIIIKKCWDDLVLSCGYTVGDLIPIIDREQILMAAGQYKSRGKRSLDMVYVPYFTFSSQKRIFSDEEFLQYLNHEDAFIKRTAWEWIKKDLPKISKKRIYYGCVREEMRRMETSTYKMGDTQALQEPKIA